jgi:diamine N-acetyltransferase
MTEHPSEPARPLPIIRGERVFLRADERSDIPNFVRWLNDSETASFLSFRAPMSEAMEQQWFTQMVERQGKDSYHFVMCRLDDEQPFGTISLFNIDLVNGSAGIGIAIGEKNLWGQGLGTDAMNALLDFGFGHLRLERLWLHVYDYNVRGRRSYEKSGFILEGTERHAVYVRGRHHDVNVMSVLRDEWSAMARKKMWDYESDER